MDNFSIYSNDAYTNENIEVIFTPPSYIVSYTYRVYRGNELISVIKVDSNESSTITLDTTGVFKIKVEANSARFSYTYESGEYLIDKQAPEIKVKSSVLRMRTNDRLSVFEGVKVTDNIDGDILNKLTSNIDELDLTKTGTKSLIYTVTDNAGNVASKEVVINVYPSSVMTLATIQIAFILFLLLVIDRLSKYLHLIFVERRYAKYSVEATVDDTPSLFDVLSHFYYQVVFSLSKVIKRSKLLSEYAKRYNKYMIFTKDKYNDATSIVAIKVLCSLAFVILAVLSRALQYKTLNVYEVTLPLVVGFFVVDIMYAIKYRMYFDKIENDLLQAVIIMNNAFKSGRSIVQAISLVGNELPGIVGQQFIIMKKELSKGLSLDVVFKRFAERINIEEVNYLTASLTILNKTGGNIIKVFTSIENSLFMKKKLKLELKSLTSSSRIIMWVLFFIPVLYVFIISVLNPTYFDPFFKTPLGLMLLLLSIIFYIIYIVIVRKILKVRM